MKLEDYSTRQIKIWAESTVAVYENGYLSNRGSLGEYKLNSLFLEGFIITGKDSFGDMTVIDVAGLEYAISSKSLARALRKAKKDHERERRARWAQEKKLMAEMLGCKNGFQRMAVNDAAVGINIAEDSPEETYILFITKEIRHSFKRIAWNAPLEYVGKI